MGHEYLEGVGDDECRHEHGQHAEAQQEDGDDAGFAHTDALYVGIADFLTRHETEMLRQKPVHLVDGFRGYRIAVLGEVEVDHGGYCGIEVAHSLHPCDEVVGSHDRASII